MRNRLFQAMTAMMIAGCMTMTTMGAAFAADSTDDNNVDVEEDLTNHDVIDTSAKGSLTIYKYDMTAAQQAGVYEEGSVTATGQKDATLQDTLAAYAITGVEFTYLRTGAIEQYNYTEQNTEDGTATGTGTFVEVVYELPESLVEVLNFGIEEGETLRLDTVADTDGNDSNNAVDMTAAGVSAPCVKSGMLHYTSDQINSALASFIQMDDVTAKNALEAYVTGNMAAVAMDLTDAYGYTYADNLDLGLYLVVETEVPENVVETVNPFFVSIPMTNQAADTGHTSSDDEENEADGTGGEYWFYDITVYPKNQTGNPTLDKLVRNATGEEATEAGESEGMEYIISNFTDDYVTYHSLDAGTSEEDAAEAFAAQRGDSQYATTTDGAAAIPGATDEKDDDGNYVTHNDNDGTSSHTDVDSANSDGVGDVVVRTETVVGEYEYASTTTASEGDVLDYILVSKLPHISSTATYLTEYEFVDELYKGLEYDNDAVIAFYTSAEDAYTNHTEDAVAIWVPAEVDDFGDPVEEEKYTCVIKTPTDDSLTKFTIAMTSLGLDIINGVTDSENVSNVMLADDAVATNGYSDYYMVVSYTATVHSDESVTLGDDGNINAVSLAWARTSMDYADTLEDETIVYVYGIDLTKTFSDGSTGADYFDKVTFNLYDKTDGYYVIAEQAKDGLYYVTGKTVYQSEADLADEEDVHTSLVNGEVVTDPVYATVFTPDSEGHLVIYGLEGDTYGLVELTTASGFSLLADEIVIDIHTATCSIEASIAGWTGQEYTEDDYDEDGHLVTDGENDRGHVDMLVGTEENGGFTSGSAAVDDITATMITDAQSANVSGDTSEHAIVKLAIENTSNFTLPLTGGAGLYLVTILGAIVAAIGCWIAFGRKSGRKHKNGQNA